MNLLSLHDWLALCRTLGIPHVPATPVGALTRTDLYAILDGNPISSSAYALLARCRTPVPETLLRWDCCASLTIKQHLAHGRWAWREEFSLLEVDDPRFFEIFGEYGGDAVTVWRRPWIQAVIVDSYPVEYRLFADRGELLGISNYYPQRPLPETKEALMDCERIFAWGNALIEQIPAFTADFLKTPHGLLFLEGGPPHRVDQLAGSAHPCCFAPGEIRGIAFAPRS